VQHRRAIGEDEGDEDVERALLGHPAEGREDDLPRLSAKHLDNRRARHLLLIEDALEYRRLEDAQANPHADRDHDDADPERHAPSPGQELIAGNRAEHEHHDVGDEEPGRSAPLRPGGDEAAMCVGLGPFHRDQGRATPFAADADPLDEAHRRQDHRAPDADRGVARDEADRKGRQPGQEQRCD